MFSRWPSNTVDKAVDYAGILRICIYIYKMVCWTNWPCMKRYIHMELALVWVWSFIRSYGGNQVILSPSPMGFQNAVILLIAQLVDMCEYVGLDFSYLIPKTLHCSCAVVHLSKASNQMCCLSVILFCLTWSSVRQLQGEWKKCIYDTKAKEFSTACSLWGFLLSIRNSSLRDESVCISLAAALFIYKHSFTQLFTFLHISWQANAQFYSKHDLSRNSIALNKPVKHALKCIGILLKHCKSTVECIWAETHEELGRGFF